MLGKARLMVVAFACLSATSMLALAVAHFWQTAEQPSSSMVAPAPAQTASLNLGVAPPDAAPSAPTFDVVRIEEGGGAVVAGRSEPNWRVELLVNGEVVGATIANKGGEWAIVPDHSLGAADHVLSLRATSNTGEQVATLQSIVVGNIGRGENPIVLLDDPALPTSVLQRPEVAALALSPVDRTGAAAPAKDATAPDSKGLTEQAPLALEAITYANGKLSISGRAADGLKLRIYLNDAFTKEVTSQAGQQFATTIEATLPAGRYRVRVDALTTGPGQVSARVEVPFDYEPEPLVAAAEAHVPSPLPLTAAASALVSKLAEPKVVIVTRGDNLWRIAHRSYGAGLRYTSIYRANESQIRDPNQIFPGQIFLVPAVGPGSRH